MRPSVVTARRRDLDTFAANLADVYRGLVRIGWDPSTAAEFVDGLNENRYEVITLRKEVDVLKNIIKTKGARQPVAAG